MLGPLCSGFLSWPFLNLYSVPLSHPQAFSVVAYCMAREALRSIFNGKGSYSSTTDRLNFMYIYVISLISSHSLSKGKKK